MSENERETFERVPDVPTERTWLEERYDNALAGWDYSQSQAENRARDNEAWADERALHWGGANPYELVTDNEAELRRNESAQDEYLNRNFYSKSDFWPAAREAEDDPDLKQEQAKSRGLHR